MDAAHAQIEPRHLLRLDLALSNNPQLLFSNHHHRQQQPGALCHHHRQPLPPPTTIHNASATTHHHPQWTQRTSTTMKMRWQCHITRRQQPGAPCHHCHQPLPPPITSTVTTHHHPQQTQWTPTRMKMRWQCYITTSGSTNNGACRRRCGNMPRRSDSDDGCHHHHLQYAGQLLHPVLLLSLTPNAGATSPMVTWQQYSAQHDFPSTLSMSRGIFF